MEKYTLDKLLDRYKEIITKEYDFPGFCSFYVTDADSTTAKEKPYKLKSMCMIQFDYFIRNDNGKYIMPEQTKKLYFKYLMNTFNKENIYYLV